DLEAAPAGAADDVQLVIVLGQLLEVLQQGAGGQVLRAGRMARIPFVLLAHIDEMRALGHVLRGDGLHVHALQPSPGPRGGGPAGGRPTAHAARSANRFTSGEATSTAAITSA